MRWPMISILALLTRVFNFVGNAMAGFVDYQNGDVMEHGTHNRFETLKDFGYEFNDAGELQHIQTGGRYEFNVYDTHTQNQRRYEKLGMVIEKHIYQLLEEKAGLKKAYIPIQPKNKEGKGFIFHSDDAFECDKLLLIIHGSGVVRAGQWSRRLIINHSLESGTQLPYIKKAKELGFGVLVLNSNQNFDEETGRRIRGSEDPEKHFNYVWKKMVKTSKAQHIAIVAHSYGGAITIHGAINNPDLIEKTFAVAFTDSVHGMVRIKKGNKRFLSWMTKNVCNWVSSSEELDTPLRSYEGNCARVSAGTSVHEETSWKACNSVWNFIEERLEERLGGTSQDVQDHDKESSTGNQKKQMDKNAVKEDVNSNQDQTTPDTTVNNRDDPTKEVGKDDSMDQKEKEAIENSSDDNRNTQISKNELLKSSGETTNEPVEHTEPTDIPDSSGKTTNEPNVHTEDESNQMDMETATSETDVTKNDSNESNRGNRSKGNESNRDSQAKENESKEINEQEKKKTSDSSVNSQKTVGHTERTDMPDSSGKITNKPNVHAEEESKQMDGETVTSETDVTKNDSNESNRGNRSKGNESNRDSEEKENESKEINEQENNKTSDSSVNSQKTETNDNEIHENSGETSNKPEEQMDSDEMDVDTDSSQIASDTKDSLSTSWNATVETYSSQNDVEMDLQPMVEL